VIETEQLRDRVRELELALGNTLAGLVDHPLVEEVRHIGLLAGVEISADALAEDPDLTERVVVSARKQGLLVRNLVGRTLHISPPFVLTDAEVAELARRLELALDAVGQPAAANPRRVSSKPSADR
jgi:4-aminobutyrate--pyruvate transaminase